MLQRSDRPGAGQARQAIAATVHAYSGRGCAERVAQELATTRTLLRANALGSRGASEVSGVSASAEQSPKTTGTPDERARTASGKEMTVKRIRINRRGTQRERPWLEDLPPDPRDPDVVRAKALVRSRLTGWPPKPTATPYSSS